MKERLISPAYAAMMIPSISMCGLFCISSRSLNVPGSDSSALQTRYLTMWVWGRNETFLPIWKHRSPGAQILDDLAAVVGVERPDVLAVDGCHRRDVAGAQALEAPDRDVGVLGRRRDHRLVKLVGALERARDVGAHEHVV